MNKIAEPLTPKEQKELQTYITAMQELSSTEPPFASDDRDEADK